MAQFESVASVLAWFGLVALFVTSIYEWRRSTARVREGQPANRTIAITLTVLFLVVLLSKVLSLTD